MYIENVPNRKSPPAVLLRRCWREGKKVRKETLANLTRWPAHVVDAIRRALKGDRLVAIDDVFAIERSLPHGHVEAILKMVRRLGLDSLIAAKRSRQRDLVVAMIVERMIDPCSKLASVRRWADTSLAGELAIEDAKVDELYGALKWLLKRQKRIEGKLARRHLEESAVALYDVSSSYFEGRTCPLLAHGHSRDHRRDRPQIVYGVLADKAGRPVSVDVYQGNTADPATVADQVEKLRGRFGLQRVVLVGDRGMLTSARIEEIARRPGLGWISALRNQAIARLARAGEVDMSLFDERNLAEIESPDFPGERLIVCLNPHLADERRRKRDDLLEAAETDLRRIEAEVGRRTKTPLSADRIAVKVDRALTQRKVKKHFRQTIEAGRFEWSRDNDSIASQAALDGIYIVRTSEPRERLTAPDAVRTYKSLSQVERTFRCLKGIDLRVRPVFHRLEETVRAHVFLCVLAYYIEWHLRQAWAPLLFADEELEGERSRRDPVMRPEPSSSCKRKKATKKTADGLDVQSWETLLDHLATRCQNQCRARGVGDFEPITIVTEATRLQSRALDLVETYPVSGI